MRSNDRQADVLRAIRVERGFVRSAAGSVLIEAGRTRVICTASVLSEVPKWSADPTQGWVTAEYGMLPGSTRPRKPRSTGGKIDGRATEIQRLIGRSLRAVTDMAALGPRTIAVDCDVIEADGGTRTLSITGAFVALVDAVRSIAAELPQPGRLPLRDSVAAVSVGLSDGVAMLDLDYREDSSAAVDMNVVMTGAGRFVEVQGTGEHATFSAEELDAMLRLARRGIEQLTAVQRAALAGDWPFA
jgi:ribonuclease PH